MRTERPTESGTASSLPGRKAVPMIPDHPILWLGVRDPKAGRMAIRAVALLILIAILFWAAAMISSNFKESFVACIFTAYAMHLVVKFLIVTEASRRLNEDRRSGALELLLATPIGVKEILEGQRKAVWQVFRPVMWMLTLANVGLIYTIFSFPGQLHMNSSDRGIFFEMFAGGVLMLFLDFRALGWVGMWKGLNARKHHIAIIGTIGQILFLPWAIIFFMVFLERGFRSAGQVGVVVGAWFIVGAMIDVFSAIAARRKLEQHFRSVAIGIKGTGG